MEIFLSLLPLVLTLLAVILVVVVMRRMNSGRNETINNINQTIDRMKKKEK